MGDWVLWLGEELRRCECGAFLTYEPARIIGPGEYIPWSGPSSSCEWDCKRCGRTTRDDVPLTYPEDNCRCVYPTRDNQGD